MCFLFLFLLLFSSIVWIPADVLGSQIYRSLNAGGKKKRRAERRRSVKAPDLNVSSFGARKADVNIHAARYNKICRARQSNPNQRSHFKDFHPSVT